MNKAFTPALVRSLMSLGNLKARTRAGVNAVAIGQQHWERSLSDSKIIVLVM